ncbi:IQ domain-containing protein K [Anthophora plagiata]
MCSTLSKKNIEENVQTPETLNSFHSCDCNNFVKQEETEVITPEEDDELPSNYLDQRIFGLLMPALKETLIEASKWNALRVQKCRFNGLDYISEILWNRNPLRSQTYSPPLNVFEIPPFREYLRLHPRPYYPKSWLWSEDEAALYIQRYVRGWLVRKQPDVQEMRQFWKDVGGKQLFGKSKSCVAHMQYLGKTEDDTKQVITDQDLLRCERYRSKAVEYKIMRKLKKRSTF